MLLFLWISAGVLVSGAIYGAFFIHYLDKELKSLELDLGVLKHELKMLKTSLTRTVENRLKDNQFAQTTLQGISQRINRLQSEKADKSKANGVYTSEQLKK